MKPIHFLGVLLAAFTLQAQNVNQTIAKPSAINYIIGQQDANSQVWQKITQTLDARGNTVYQTNQAYVELATGLNHLVNGQWVASKEEIDISPDGSSASATSGQHQVYFPGDIYSRQVKLVTPDGQTLESELIGLAYSDGTNSVLLAVATNSTGAVLPSGNQVIYTNAFAGLNADLLYTYTKAGFQQDVVLRAQPPDPDSLGLNPATTRLQVLTEFFNPPQPVVTKATVPTDAGNLEDDGLGFGVMQMGHGKALLIGANSPTVDVEKRWVVLAGRQFLIEEVPIASIAKAIDSLPPFIGQAKGGAKPVLSKNLNLPLRRLVHTSPKRTFLAGAMTPDRGLLLDYTLTLNGNLTNYTFQGDTTYYISGTVNLWGTNNVIEGGAVLKYTNNAALLVNQGSTTPAVQFQTSAYRPVIFTAWNDNSVGDIISGSTGTPTNYCANPALGLNAPSFAPNIANFRIAYAQQAISLASTSPTIANGQIVNCQNGIVVNGASPNLENVLFASVSNDFNYTGSGALTVQNATLSGGSYLAVCSSSGVSLSLTNCILANVTNLTNGSVTLSGDFNGFYNSPIFGTDQATNNSYPFQAAGAGDYYLTNGCNFFTAGTTNIDPVLLASLGAKTVWPPLIYSNIMVSTNVTLGPQALRDTNSPPNLGYHYDPIDYLVDQYAITNAVLTLTNGVAVACYDDTGIWPQDGSSIASMGTPQSPNWFVRYQSAQEQPLLLSTISNSSPSSATMFNPYHYGSTGANAMFRFSKFASPAGGGNHLLDNSYPWTYNSLTVQDCEFWSALNSFGGDTNTVVALKNDLFVRSGFDATGSATNSLSLTNNLFWGVGLTGNPSRIKLLPASGSVWYAFNNAFDTCIFNPADSCTNGYNAYLNCTNYLSPTNSTDIFLPNSLAYQTGPFGNFYQPTNSPLINAGNTNASALGLYHCTVTTNETVEGTNIVSIGYHYIATDTNGLPLDSNGNGIPDYLEDAAGNGQPFTVTLIAPLTGSSYGGPTNIFIQATLIDWRNLVTNVEFVQGAVQIAGMTNSPYTYTWPVVAGSYSLTAIGQDNGGVIATSAPVNVTVTNQSLKLWLRADLGVTNNGSGQISVWADQSGNTNNAKQSTMSHQPLYVTNALNGLPVVRFNRTNDQYLLMTNFLNGTTQAEAFLVLKSADLLSTTTGLWNMGSGTYSLIGYPYSNGQIVDDFGSTSTYTVGRPAQALSQYHVYEVAGQTNFWGAWVNGVLQYQTAINTYGVNTSYSYLDLGCSYYGSSPFSYFSGDVAEVLIFNRTLSANERWTVNSYLDLKYGLVTNAPTAPTNLVANAISTNQIGLTWNFNLGTSSTSFQIARATTSNGIYTVVGQVANALSYVDTNLAAGTTYYYEVAAQNAAGTSWYSNPAWATTPTNGVTLPFGNLALWLKADTGVGTRTTTNNVGEWFDQSGNYNNATQTTTSHQPLYVTNALNGLPVVRFNPTNSQDFTLPNFLSGTTGAEAFVVLKVAVAVPGVVRALWQWGHGSGGWDAYPNASGQIVEDFESTSTHTVGSPAQPLNLYHVYEVAGQTNYWAAWVNGILQSSTNINTVGVNTTLALGYNGNNYFGGDVAEVLVFNRTLSASERTTVNTYLDGKYALVPAVPATPTNLVANAISTNQIGLTWNETLNGGATQVSIERSTSTNGPFAVVAQVGDALSYVDTNLAAGTTYYYQVRAINLTTWSPYSNMAQATTLTNGVSLPLESLLVWLKADTGLTQIGTNTPVNIWQDQSGNGNNATQLSQSHQPTWLAGALNGMPVIQFNGYYSPTNSYLALPNFLGNAAQAEAIVVLQAPVDPPVWNHGLWHFGTSGAGILGYPTTSGTIQDDFGTSPSLDLGVPAFPLTQPHIYDVYSKTNDWSAWINGIIQYHTANQVVSFTTAPTLGASGDYNGNINFAGNIAELLIFNRTLTAGERAIVNGYLNAKYGLAPAIPPTPTNLAATAVSPTQIGLTWSETLNWGITQISIERSTSSTGPFSAVAQILGANSYIDTNLAASTTYYYRVRAINLAQWSGYSNETNATTMAAGADMPLGNLLLWLKADSGLPEAGSNTLVSFWVDQSGNNNNADVPALANQALLVTNTLNGEPAVQFNGSNSYFNLPGFLNRTVAADAFVVLQAATNLPSKYPPLWHLGGASSGLLGYPDVHGNIVDDFGSASANTAGKPTQSLTLFHVYEAAAQANNWSAWINGLLQFTTTNNLYSVNPSPTLGENSSSGYYYYFAGNVAEILVFNRPLTGGEKLAVGTYLFSKYSLLQYATNTSSPSSPTNMVTFGLAPGQLNLHWARTSTNETAFSIERKSGAGGVYQIVGSTVLGVTNFVDATATPANTNFYHVKALNYFGSSGYSPEISPPSVSLTNWPVTILANSTNLIGAQAADANGTITNVGFYAGGVNEVFLFGTSTSAPYTANWVSGREGPWCLAAMAADSLGNSQFSAPVTVTVYLDSSGDGIPDYLQVLQGNDPLNPWTPPSGDTNTSPPTINLIVPANATLLP